MWVLISAIAKTIVFSTQNQGGNTSQVISYKNIHNYCRKLVMYTIEYKIVRNSHLLSHKNWHFLKCHSNCPTNKHKLLTHKIIKAAIDCSYVYCAGKYDKVLQTHTFLFKSTIVFTGVKKKRSTDITAKNTKQKNLVCNTNYNKNIS